jgi:antibiotic biosynthesis monooxygenase (ABM) superfamily enzyme
VLYLTGAGVSESYKGSPPWAIPVLILLLIFEIICILALFAWKKWGFWGFCAINLIGLIVDIGLGINMVWSSIAVLVSIAILFGVLNIGQDDKGWPQLD